MQRGSSSESKSDESRTLSSGDIRHKEIANSLCEKIKSLLQEIIEPRYHYNGHAFSQRLVEIISLTMIARLCAEDENHVAGFFSAIKNPRNNQTWVAFAERYGQMCDAVIDFSLVITAPDYIEETDRTILGALVTAFQGLNAIACGNAREPFTPAPVARFCLTEAGMLSALMSTMPTLKELKLVALYTNPESLVREVSGSLTDNSAETIETVFAQQRQMSLDACLECEKDAFLKRLTLKMNDPTRPITLSEYIHMHGISRSKWVSLLVVAAATLTEPCEQLLREQIPGIPSDPTALTLKGFITGAGLRIFSLFIMAGAASAAEYGLMRRRYAQFMRSPYAQPTTLYEGGVYGSLDDGAPNDKEAGSDSDVEPV